MRLISSAQHTNFPLIDENDAYATELGSGLTKLMTIHCRHPASSSDKVVKFAQHTNFPLIGENDAYATELEAGLTKLITIHCRHPASSSDKVVKFSSIQQVRSKNSGYKCNLYFCYGVNRPIFSTIQLFT